MFKNKTILKELTRICNQLQILETEIVFRNKKYNVTTENKLISLINILYSECYALKESYQSKADFSYNYQLNTDEKFLKELSENNQTKERIHLGWKINQNYPNGFLEVTKNNKNKIIHNNDIINQDHTFVSFISKKEDRLRQPTFYYSFSNETIQLDKEITRIYWNITSEGAAKLIKIITEKLNYYLIPFLFKCLNHPDLYFRRDAAVLYIEDKNLKILNFLLPEICIEMKTYLEKDVPLFTFKYFNGVGIAQSPNSQESFGMNRINILAESLLNNINCKDILILINNISNNFLKKGVNPDLPYLNRGNKIIIK